MTPYEAQAPSMDDAHARLRRDVAAGDAYRGYIYGYPHKTAYRAFAPPRDLAATWAAEPAVSRLHGYLHLPFCEMRCGFCNLFTTANPKADMVDAYLAALAREMAVTATALPRNAGFARLAFGGGTPTWLQPAELERLFTLLEDHFNLRPRDVPTSIETSPATATPARLALLRQLGVQRVSIGVQSLLIEEAHAMGRPHRQADVLAALDALAEADFPILNIDLIYGAHQSLADFLHSLDQVIARAPQEIFLYPLYIRPLTGLGRKGGQMDDAAWNAHRRAAYRAGRDRLLAAGYAQHSMRLFARADSTATAHWPEYDASADGMLGLGCGARSYTSQLHYSQDYAVARGGVLQIIEDYAARDERAMGQITHGIALDEDDRRRRFILLWLMQACGVDMAQYRARFGGDMLAHFPALKALLAEGLATQTSTRFALTATGLEFSDLIGPWFHGPRIATLMEGWAWR